MSITPSRPRGSAFDASQWLIQSPDDMTSSNDPATAIGKPANHVSYIRGNTRYIRAPLRAPRVQDTRVPDHWTAETLAEQLAILDREYESQRKMKTAGPIVPGDIVDVYYGNNILYPEAEVITTPASYVQLRILGDLVVFISGDFQMLRKPQPPKDTTA